MADLLTLPRVGRSETFADLVRGWNGGALVHDGRHSGARRSCAAESWPLVASSRLHQANQRHATRYRSEAHPMTDNARDKEAAMLECCPDRDGRAGRATHAGGGERLSRRRNDPADTCMTPVSACLGRRYVLRGSPSELLESAETVRRGWINLPRLRDRLERRLQEVRQGASS
jgi:hypothetical protein